MNLLEYLNETDLNTYEKRAIIELATIDKTTATQLIKKGGIPQGRIYTTLQELQRKGIVVIHPTKPKQYSIPDVKEALKQYHAQKKYALEEQEQHIKTITLTQKTILPPETTTSVTLYQGREERLNAITTLRKRARKEILQIAPLFTGTYATRRAFEETLRNKNITCKIIIPTITPQNKEQVRIVLKNGGEVRTYKTKHLLSTTISDRKEALLGVQDHTKNEERITLYTTNPEIIETLVHTFQQQWKKGKRVKKKDERSEIRDVRGKK